MSGLQCQARTDRIPSGSDPVQYGNRQEAARLRPWRKKVVDGVASSQIKERASALQSKTRKSGGFEISDGTRASVAKCMEYPQMVGLRLLYRLIAS
jgi:hypothetical protein